MSYINELKQLCSELGCDIKENAPLSEHVTFRFGGPCSALVSINSAGSAARLAVWLRENSVPFFILGNGSNIIVPDDGYDGVILLFGSGFAGISVDDTTITCDSGALLSSVCAHAQQHGLTGMERLFGIPGTVGGALYMNAGAYGCEMIDVVISAEYIGTDGRIHSVDRSEMELSYRKSRFAESGDIITSVKFGLSHGDSDEIKAEMRSYMKKRSDKQPLDFPSAGSTFKRPVGGYAAQLIEECGLKGLTCGGAMVSEKHSGFVINKGYASCSDVLTLCSQIHDTVKEKTGIELELEPIILR
ncbi:MAG: UDP-N-acetylmuramate dehydrogenase [Ruminococcus sp.]|nr:UDP-N-acetylmuramate dehydrogenase [Ruminococcus sp.]